MPQKITQLPITHDYVFKRVFSYEGNEAILKDFLEAILNIKINNIQIKNPELIKTYEEDKLSILDIKVQADNNTIIDVEMQMQNKHDLKERSTTYLGKLVAEQLQSGETYTNLKNTIVIFLLNFNLYKRNSYHSIGKMKFDKTTKEAYIDMGYIEEDDIASPYIQIHIIELPKFKKKNPDMKAKVNQWLWLLSGEEEKINMAQKANEKVKKAVETLNRISLDPEEREIYESIQMRNFLQRISNQKFLEQGINQEKKEIAKKLLLENITIDQIVKITGLTKKEIKELNEN